MFTKTSIRIDEHTNPAMTQRLQQQLVSNVSKFIDADYSEIGRRLEELDREWSIERVIEVETPVVIGAGAALGLLHDKKWFMLSGIGAGVLLLHVARGFHPLLTLYQQLGFRSQQVIEDEYNALRVLRKDYEHLVRH